MKEKYMIELRKVTRYEQKDIFGDWIKKADEKVVLVIQEKETGRMLSKNWWSKKNKYTDELKEAKKYHKREYFPQDKKEIKRIINRSIKSKFEDEALWFEFVEKHIFKQEILS